MTQFTETPPEGIALLNARFKGTLCEGKLYRGTVILEDSGDTYESTFENNEFHGNGTYIWANGDRYEGDFIDDIRTGKGIFTWANGNRYAGDFVDGRIEGFGILFLPNGDYREGRWRNSQFVG